MKKSLGILPVITHLFLLISVISIKGQDCKTNLQKKDEKPICAMAVVEFSKIKTNVIEGIITFDDKPFEDAIVEVYKISKKQKTLVGTNKTLADGKFCFKNFSKGRHFIKAGGFKFGFNCSEIKVEVKGKTKRLIIIPLNVGA